ncbi:uncharacterized protein [Rutidosis leptorrhynchoides]|uniref:uncharacterized protein n=1 Tax=Rutidosis leptorrhynchoides TaxID=125765 RepID=UPI003A99BCAD
MDFHTHNANGFKYHYKCKGMKLTHICFADDLLVFCHGNVRSVKVIKKVLDDFEQVSGLQPNNHKSTIFFGNVDTVTQHSIIEVMHFDVGKLPLKYLGVPLLAKKLGIKDCKSLVDKVRIKVNNWKTRKLSYAGRLQLVASVLTSDSNADILDFCGFLWCQDISSKGKAKVAWKDVCIPKDQGGLGLRPLRDWNETLMVKQIWRIVAKEDSLWSKWVNLIELKSKVKPHVNFDGDIFRWVTNEGKKTVFSTQQGKILYRGIPDNMPDIMQDMAKYPYSRNIWSIINRLLIAASVYFIWQERNHRIFRKVHRDEAAICKDIQNFMQLKLLTFKVKQIWAVKRAAKVWGLKCLNSSFSM